MSSIREAIDRACDELEARLVVVRREQQRGAQDHTDRYIEHVGEERGILLALRLIRGTEPPSDPGIAR